MDISKAPMGRFLNQCFQQKLKDLECFAKTDFHFFLSDGVLLKDPCGLNKDVNFKCAAFC